LFDFKKMSPCRGRKGEPVSLETGWRERALANGCDSNCLKGNRRLSADSQTRYSVS